MLMMVFPFRLSDRSRILREDNLDGEWVPCHCIFPTVGN